MHRKKKTHVQIETRLTKEYICWNCIQYICISTGGVFLRRYEYLKQDSNNNLKQFLYFLTINFWKKVN